MNSRRGVARSGVAASRARGARAGSRPSIVVAGATLLLFLIIPLVAGAEPDGLIPPAPDLPATMAPSVVPSPDDPLKVRDHVDEVVRGITAPPSQSPPPTGGGEAGEDPPGEDGGGGGGGGSPGQDRGGDDSSLSPVTNPMPAGSTDRDSPANAADDLPVFETKHAWRAVSPGLGTLATRARSLVAPLAAPMGLGIVAVMLLGLATRGPGVISKLSEELESADGRQVWRL
jgi:hypothetical protein